ncbi:hypothetical protein [Endozoicomonas elysicola]|uniref:Uncharacterized protein n=1 Tax=Endozoicomonas elysicola TaxID=305900 RepID=A0A081KEE3_9GAMM|nr:hypothetical protein [Endozoicomonas elysicola]KEI72519.1 hypothetical protein GV64_18890 [Endozoicomonas elysicola]
MDSTSSPPEVHGEQATSALRTCHVSEPKNYKLSGKTDSGRQVDPNNESSNTTPPASVHHQGKTTSTWKKTDISDRKVDTSSQANNEDTDISTSKPPGYLKDLDLPPEMHAPLARSIEMAEKGNLTPEQLLDIIFNINMGKQFQRKLDKEFKKHKAPNDRYSKMHSKSKKALSAYQEQAALHSSSTSLKNVLESTESPESVLPIPQVSDPHNNPFTRQISDNKVTALLDELQKKSELQKSKDLKKITVCLAKKLLNNEPSGLSDLDKNNIRRWFFAIVKLHRDIESPRKGSEIATTAILENSILILKQALAQSNALINPDLIAYTMIPTLLKCLDNIVSRSSTPKRIRLTFRPLIAQLCTCFIKSDCALDERLAKERAVVHRVHLKSLLETNIPSHQSIDLLAILIREGNNPQDLFSLIKIIVNFHDISDFSDETYLRNIIEALPDPDLATALNAILADDDLPLELQSSMKTNLLWIRATIATQHNDLELAEKLLRTAAEQESYMGLELALFYLDNWPNPDKARIKLTHNALLDAEKSISELDQHLWQQCMAKVSSLGFFNETSDKMRHQPRSTRKEPTHELGHSEKPSPTEALTQSLPYSPEAVADENDSLATLSSAINLAKEIIKKYQRTHQILKPAIEHIQFTVVGWKNKTFSTFEAMKPSSRNPRINKLVWYIHRCRALNDLTQEIRSYKFLINEDLGFVLHFDRLLEELVWTLLHSLNDPQAGGFKASAEEQIRAANLAKELMMVCIEYTIKPHGIVTKGRPLSDIFDEIVSWLNNIENFNNDKELQQHMRETLRYRAGSTLGHIYRTIASISNRPEMEDKAYFCFQAKTCFDPSYKKKPSTANKGGLLPE